MPKVIKSGAKTSAQLLRGLGKDKDKNGVYVKTHRVRSKSYPSIDKIPLSVLKFVDSTR
jgi:hypothetical protein